VIPTKNGGDLFQKVLDALAKQTLWHRTELIVIDSGSEDDTVKLAKQAGARVIAIAARDFNHGATRDYGISLTSSDYVILMVQDAVPVDNNVLQALLSALEEATVAGVYARQIPQADADVLTKRNLNGWLTGRTEREVRFIPHAGWYEALSAMEKYLFCNFDNVCSAIKKSVWQQQHFGEVNFGEDIDWAERVLKKGYQIVYEPKAAVIHSHHRPMSYEYKRTYVCHRKLYAMFGLHLVPRIKSIARSWFYASIIDMVYILRNEPHLTKKIPLLLKVPILNLLNVFGQYQAVKDEIQGVASSVKGV
jgi:rhamnosyltransferase